MSSLKELKTRIQSVRSTQKITSAMKMVSSVKLMKAEKVVNSFLPYEQALLQILNNYLSSQVFSNSPFREIREVRRAGLVVFASNSSLCGSYNSNVIKAMEEFISHQGIGKQDILIYPVGKKIADHCKQKNLKIAGEFEDIAALPTFENTKPIADNLINSFLNNEIDRINIIYQHYVNKSTQTLKVDTFLPIDITYPTTKDIRNDYIVEPSTEEVENLLIPMVLQYHLYAAAIEANASEHAARTIAMQIATENAENILQELSLQYNKLRQESITNQILDLIGGSLQ